MRLSSCPGWIVPPAIVLAVASISAQAAPPIRDLDTKAWWRITSALSNDGMEGRDTGSLGYARAARFVAARYAAAGLKPAGDHGSFFQSVPLHEVEVEKTGTAIELVRDTGARLPLRFLHQITVRPTAALPATLAAPLVFRGYCGRNEIGDVRGKVVVCFGTRRRGLPSGAERLRAVSAGGAAALINVDDPYFSIEPPRWPAAYARSVSIRGEPPPPAEAMPVMNLSAEAFPALIAGAGRDAQTILEDGGAKRPLPAFDIPARLHAAFRLTQRDYASDNVLGLLPGTDPRLKPEVVVVSAHLDGYGYGEPVNGDAIYNGTFDDAAYVATLIRLTERRHGHGFKRSVLFAAFTGEEKGLLGATWFTCHSTVPKRNLVADINLDQLRPLFPLKILTVHGLNDTSLGDTARQVAGAMGVQARPDLEPERNLVQRADHWPFLKIGVPATGFVFGYDPGTEGERRYREWYQVRYHRPQDDLTQPWDPKAAGDFNRFFYKLAETAADAPERPSWSPESPLRPGAAPSRARP